MTEPRLTGGPLPVLGSPSPQLRESMREGDHCEVYVVGGWGRWVPARVLALLALERGASRVTLDFGSEGVRELTLPSETVYDNVTVRLLLHAPERKARNPSQ